jgi:hypothetical protein
VQPTPAVLRVPPSRCFWCAPTRFRPAPTLAPGAAFPQLSFGGASGAKVVRPTVPWQLVQDAAKPPLCE